MQRVTILCVGKLKEKYWTDAIAEYSKRLSRFCSLRIEELKEEKLAENASAADEEFVSVFVCCCDQFCCFVQVFCLCCAQVIEDSLTC